MREPKILDFTGKCFYLGIDVHKSNWKVTIRSNDTFLKTISMDPSPLKLSKYMKQNYPGGTYYSVYEAGFSGYWAHRQLDTLGFKNIIVNPSDVPTTHKEKDRKDDPIDSNKLSRELCNGSLQSIYIPNTYMESMRILSRCLLQYTRRSTQVKCRIKALFNFTKESSSIDEYKRWSQAYIKEISTYTLNEKSTTFVLKHHIQELEHIRKARLKILQEIRIISKQEPVLKLLRTIPGIGCITAFTLFAELVDIKRFRNLDHLASYVGLVPSISKSDNSEVIRGITNRHCKHIRHMLIESAWISIRTDPVLTIAFDELTKGKHRHSKKTAIIRIAKKLLNRIRAVWLEGKPYAIGTIETQKAVKVAIKK